jgi:DNA anti-recombination protein RmuC
MTRPIVRDPIYRRRRFDAEIIELCVRWYITYRLSYRDLVAMMAERGIVVSHTTIYRWVIRYVPEFEKRWNRFARPVNTSWRFEVMMTEHGTQCLANKEQRDLLDKAQQSFESSFKALSADALRNNNQSFLELAQSNFATLQGEAKSNLDARQLAVDQLVQPIKDQLAKVDTKLGELELQRVGAYSAIHDQLKTLNEATLPDIRKETGSLVKALHQPMVRGRYGEMQLKRVVEMAGMLDHCDFIEQANRETEDGRLRPDMVVKLPGGRNIVIDAKTPIMAYLEALETSDEEMQRACMLQHAEQFRRHVTALGRKSYWDQFTPTPEMVVMFVPGEVFYSAALQADPTLLESSAAEKSSPHHTGHPHRVASSRGLRLAP